jgi:NADPH2:quinone reductase
VEIGKALGARVIAAAARAEKLALCRQHGADETILYETEELRERTKALTLGRGADVVYDAVGGRFSEQALRAIAWRGRLLVVGFASGQIPKIPLNLALLKGCSIVGVFLGDFARREPARFAADLAALFRWLEAGTIRPHVSGVYPLERGAEAIGLLAERRASGKLVITP